METSKKFGPFVTALLTFFVIAAIVGPLILRLTTDSETALYCLLWFVGGILVMPPLVRLGMVIVNLFRRKKYADLLPRHEQGSCGEHS